MIKAIIFDCFGVLLTENWLAFKQEKFGHNPELFARATELNHMVDAHLMSEADYIIEISALACTTPLETTRMLRNVAANQPLIDMAAELKKQYKVGMLSNISSDWFEVLFKPEELALFDALTLSYQVGVAKPDPRIYNIAASQLGVSCEQCVFIDDVESNVTAAKERGMQGIVYTNTQSFIDELALRGIIDST
jgi:epoxide hydrolase-like predicted phosphatase